MMLCPLFKKWCGPHERGPRAGHTWDYGPTYVDMLGKGREEQEVQEGQEDFILCDSSRNENRANRME